MRSVTEMVRTVTGGARSGPRPPSARENRRSRAALAAVVAGCVAVTGVAVAGAGNASPGMKFAQPGRYIYNSTLGKIFHVNGSTKSVDQEIPLPGAGPGTQVVETDQNGYVLSRGRTFQFGKSSLDVADPLPAPIDELPVVLEAGGAAFAVYRDSGQIVRFGEKVASAKVGAPLGPPVVTADGTVWVHRPGSGQLCLLPLDADRLACPAELPSGHTGSLAVVGANQVVFVDTTAREMYAVDDGGLGRKVLLPIDDLPRDAIVAPNDVTGRLAIVDPHQSVLHLVDAAGLTSGKADGPPVRKQLRKGKYERIVSSGNSLALIDESTDTLVTLDRNGDERTSRKIPEPSKESKVGPEDKTGLYRGGDSRLYVASRSGEQVMVVEDTGDVVAVDTKAARPDQRKTPDADKPTAKPSTPDRPVQPPPTSKPPQPPTTGDPRPPDQPTAKPTDRPTDRPTQDKPTGRPTQDKPTDPPSTDRPDKPTPPPVKPTTPVKPTVQAGRPGAPRSVSGKPGNASVLVTWDAAAANGAAVTAYTLSWNGGSVRLGPAARSRNVTGLTNGTGYTFTVRATNRVGTGPGSSTSRVVPTGGVPDAPGNFQVTTSGSSLRLSWTRPNLKGTTLQGYDFAANPTQGQGTGKADSTSGTSATLSGLTSGATYRVTVRATTTDAQGNFVLGKQAVRTIVVGGGGSTTTPKLVASRGAATTHGGGEQACEAPGCAFIKVVGTGLKPNTMYDFTPYTTQWQPSNPGAQLRTDSEGNITIDDRFATDAPGQQVWVVASAPGENDITSNKFTWRS
ncbi:fibronectin type III domain-containing protein [Kribbella sp. NPDC051770]|uniref:fibronectin type III domain-containing protein n=1 Tax=Kribbella sp. NPDC051770 TaxID=3155413 RepID=UPI003416E40D